MLVAQGDVEAYDLVMAPTGVCDCNLAELLYSRDC